MISLIEIFRILRKGNTPTEIDWKSIFSSVWHKTEKFPIEQIVGLKEEIAKVTTNFKGYHTSLAELLIAHPQIDNKKDFFAWVGSPYPGTVHKVFADKGAWTDTGEVPTQEEIDLSEYAKKIDVNKKADFENTDGDQVVYAHEGKIDVSQKVDKSTIINVSQDNNDSVYIDRLSARNAVSAENRSKGQIIVYQLKDASAPITEIYIGDLSEEWTLEKHWMELPYIKDAPSEDIQQDDFVIPYRDSNNYTPDRTVLYYEFQDSIRGKVLDKIQLKANEGTLTIRVSNINPVGVIETVLRTYKVNIPSNGLQVITLPEEIIIGEDEYIGFIAEQGQGARWARFNANGISGSEPNYVAGGCYSLNYLGHREYQAHSNINIGISIKKESTNIPTAPKSSKVPTFNQLSGLALRYQVSDSSYPFSLTDENGNDVMRVDLTGETKFGKLALPENITESIKKTIDDILGNVSIGGSGGTYNDRDAKLWGMGGDKFVFIHLSDTHSYMPAFEKIIEVKKYYGTLIKAYIHSGDIIESGQGVETLLERLAKKNFQVPLLWCMGNHDGESDSTAINTKAQQYDRLIAPFKDKWNAVTQENKCYYYKDVGYNIRLITLDLFDSIDRPTNQNLADRAMSDEQIQWLVNVLQEANDKGLHIIVNSHMVPSGTGSQDGNLITDLLLAFKNGTAVANTYVGKGAYPDITVNTSFSKKGNFIAFLAGHDHREATGTNSVGRFKISSFSGIRHNQDGFLRIIGTPTEHNFDIVIVDTKAKKLKTFRVGASYTPDGNKNSSELELDY